VRALLILVAPIVGLSLSGCEWLQDREEIRACESFTKASLRSPATYDRASVTVAPDEAISLAEYRRQYVGAADDQQARLAMAMVQRGPLALRRAVVNYDAANAYGTPIRGLNICEFLVVRGQLVGEGDLERRAGAAANRVEARGVAENLNNPELRRLTARRGESLIECCVR